VSGFSESSTFTSIVPRTMMSFGVASGQASAAINSLRLVTVTVRFGAAFEPPVVPRGSAAVVTEAQPSSSASTARAGSAAGSAARTGAIRKPMDNRQPSGRVRLDKNIEFPRKNCRKCADTGPWPRNDTGFQRTGIPEQKQAPMRQGGDGGHKNARAPRGRLLHGRRCRSTVNACCNVPKIAATRCRVTGHNARHAH
jgi:hypothetical protein